MSETVVELKPAPLALSLPRDAELRRELVDLTR